MDALRQGEVMPVFINAARRTFYEKGYPTAKPPRVELTSKPRTVLTLSSLGEYIQWEFWGNSDDRLPAKAFATMGKLGAEAIIRKHNNRIALRTERQTRDDLLATATAVMP